MLFQNSKHNLIFPVFKVGVGMSWGWMVWENATQSIIDLIEKKLIKHKP